MMSRVLILISACMYYSGLIRLGRWWTRMLGPHLVILNYHRAAQGDLRRQMLYLRRHYNVLHLKDALQELQTLHKDELRRGYARTPLVLSFDDGYRDNYTYGAQLARELQVPITIFLPPGYIESGRRFWWEEGEHLVADAQVKQAIIEEKLYHLDQVEERKALANAIDQHLCYASSVAEREEFLESIRELLVVSAPITDEEWETLPLSWAEIQAMSENEWVSFGAHTMHHPILSCLADPTELYYEVNECRTVLEQRLKQPIEAFAYPVGGFKHIGEQSPQVVQAAGYKWALTTEDGFNTPKTDPYLLRRVIVDVDQHWLMVAAKASGIWGVFSRLGWKVIKLLWKDAPEPIPFSPPGTLLARKTPVPSDVQPLKK